jgi:Mn2+/Fe2+ NRAMP family transporter
MYKSGETFSDKGTLFASQLINLYTKNLGEFSYIFIAIAAFTTMFSTTITTMDASPRVMNRTTKILFNKELNYGYWFWILFLFLGTFLILKYFMSNMGLLIKTATILSFLSAPFYAILNFTLITGKQTPKEHQPGISLKVLSYTGIFFLIGFSVWFLMSL